MKAGKEISDEEKLRQVEVVLSGEKLRHSVFCNFAAFRKTVEDCPTCKDLYITEDSAMDVHMRATNCLPEDR